MKGIPNLSFALIYAILITSADPKHSGHTLSSKTGDCDQATDSPPRSNEPAEPIAKDKGQTQESSPAHSVEETTTPEETEAEGVKPDTDTTGNCARQGVREEGDSESLCEQDTTEEEEMGRSKKKGKGGAENKRLLPAESVNFPSTLEGFGYFFDKDGKLKEIGTNEPFNFHYAPTDPSLNQRRYEALGEVVTEHVYKLLEEQGKLKRVTVPVDARRGEVTTFFFMSEDALSNPDRLLVLIHGSGAVRAGQWARRLIINDCLDSGTQLPFIKRATQHGYGVVVMNTNDNSGWSKDGRYATIRGSSTPDDHAQYVWDNYVLPSAAKRIDIVAHSYGGCITVTLAQKYFKMFEKRVGKIAFTDSAHSLDGFFGPSKSVCNFLVMRAVNWVTSDEPLGEWLTRGDDGRIPRVSAGTLKHEETSWCAFDEIFKWFLASEDEE